MELQQIKETVKNILVERLNIDPQDVKSDDASLFDDDGWAIDSVDVIDLVLGIEKTFDVRVGQDEQLKQHFDSVDTLAAFIQSQLKQPAAA